MQSFEAFSKTIIPVYPIQDYLQWKQDQDQDSFNLSFAMWKELFHDKIQTLLAILGDKLAESDPAKLNEEEFLRLSYMVCSYHRHIDQQARQEIEQITGGQYDPL